ncbi:MAG TPA: Xaa-Pro peptidase family protein [Lentisphaeria bacterium]|nr:Xaa-Pro peptidase family protein [Lentisphaeria bacterium]
MSRKKIKGRLIYAASERCADLLYETGFSAPDPFLWYSIEGQSTIVVSVLEVGRAVKQCHPGIQVMSLPEAARQWGLRRGSVRRKMANYIVAMARHLQVNVWEVPTYFPYGLATELLKRDLALIPKSDFSPGRACKSAQEIKYVRSGVRLAEQGLARAVDILRQAKIGRDGVLLWQGQPLLAETLKGEIDAEIARLGGTSSHTIAAHGPQAADPHQQGYGPIQAHTPITLDIFPRDDATGYCGDLTRTVVKGKAPDIVRRAFDAVYKAQQAALAMLRPGVTGATVHKAVTETLDAAGFPTDVEAKPPHGFFHSTGHGLGLEVHEAPSLSSAAATPLLVGNVVTIEPGLYYPEWGGVRLENVAVITPEGYENLTEAPIELEIP